MAKSDISLVSLTFGQCLGQADLWLDVTPTPIAPSRGIKWPREILLWISLTCGQPLGQADLWSDVPTPSRGI